MGLYSLVRSKGFKNFMTKLYGVGAAVVILGALFKINHYPFASEMLIVGLGTEAIIFFFSAFEPQHVDPDWSLVYPELAGIYEEAGSKTDEKNESLTEQLDNMLDEAKIGPDLIASLGEGMRALSDNASQLTDLSDASVATEQYSKNMQAAANSAETLSQTLGNDLEVSDEYVNNMQNVNVSVNELNNTYAQTTETLKGELDASQGLSQGIRNATESVQVFGEKYSQAAESLSKSAEALDLTGIDKDAYGTQLQGITQKLEALNAQYEMQINSSDAQNTISVDLQDNMKRFIEDLRESMESTNIYKDEAARLAQNVQALNTVYGNMLTAMNVNTNQ